MTQLASDAREMVLEQLQYRELLYQMTKRDLLLRYKQSVMGFGWAIFMPVVNTVVFSVIFMRVAPLDVGMPYPLFAFCGLLAWNFSASSFRFALTSLTSNTSLVTKVYFPREIFPLSAVLVSLVDFAAGSLALFALMAYYRITPTWALLALPLVVLVHAMFTASVCLILAMSNLFYRDVKYHLRRRDHRLDVRDGGPLSGVEFEHPVPRPPSAESVDTPHRGLPFRTAARRLT